MRYVIILIILLLLSMIFSPIDENRLPSYYVEMISSLNKTVCSAFLIDRYTIVTSVHCKHLVKAKFTDGSIKRVVKVYQSKEDDIAIYYIYESGHTLNNYPSIGFPYTFGLLSIHSHVNDIKYPLFFLLVSQDLIKDVKTSPEVHMVVDILYPLTLSVKKGNSGGPVTQNSKIVGMVYGHDIHPDVHQTYIIQGMTIKKHLDRYYTNVENNSK